MSKNSPNWPIGLFIWLTTIVVWLTWAPFLPRTEPTQVQWQFQANPVVVVGNLLLFAPIGVIIGLNACGNPVRRALIAVGIVALGSLTVETGQWFIDGRNVSPYDMLLNVGGAAIAAWAAARAFPKPRAAVANVAVGAPVLLLVFGYLALSPSATMKGSGWRIGTPAFPFSSETRSAEAGCIRVP